MGRSREAVMKRRTVINVTSDMMLPRARLMPASVAKLRYNCSACSPAASVVNVRMVVVLVSVLVSHGGARSSARSHSSALTVM